MNSAYPTLSGNPPIVIGHRGASGYLPEHTLEAYRLAIEWGADFIEPDLVSTQDGVLIARHELNLIDTTNVAEIAQFADRRQTKVVDGAEQVGFFAEDFTLAEIKELRARQPRIYRDQSHNDQFQIPTLQEIIDLVKQVEADTGKQVGIYPETKHPTYLDQLGLSLEEPLIETLVANHFTDPKRVFIQSFEVSNLKDTLTQLMAANNIDLPLVQLYDKFQLQPYDFVVSGDPRTYGDLISAESLTHFVSSYAAAIGPWKRSFVLTETIDPPAKQYFSDSTLSVGDPPASGTPLIKGGRGDQVLTERYWPARGDGVTEIKERLTGEVLPVVQNAHAAGLLVHPYTFRNEAQFLTTDYAGDPIAEYKQFYELGVDGVFSDFPDTAVKARNA